MDNLREDGIRGRRATDLGCADFKLAAQEMPGGIVKSPGAI
jgi:hypothetical protein